METRIFFNFWHKNFKIALQSGTQNFKFNFEFLEYKFESVKPVPVFYDTLHRHLLSGRQPLHYPKPARR